MDHKPRLHQVRNWPSWSVVPIGLALAGFAVVLGLVLEPAGYALSPGKVEPEPTLSAVDYSGGTSEGCHDCHFSLPALQISADNPATAETYLIEQQSLLTPHGSLGCVACHGGDGQAVDKERGHQDLIPDVTSAEPEQCIICHHDLPEQIPGDELLVPHNLVESHIVHGEPGTLFCSDCHGGVGHGFDPVSGETSCSMNVCVDCHAEQQPCMSCHQGGEPTAEMTGCNVCHEGPHDVADYLTCSCCHTSTTEWEEVEASSHPIELLGQHGETPCFGCHQFPDFQGLKYECVECHVSGHTEWGDEDCTQCHDPGATWDIVAETWDKHVEIWDKYKGDHLKVKCSGCHFESYADLDPNCDSCHQLPDSHEENYTKCWLCH